MNGTGGLYDGPSDEGGDGRLCATQSSHRSGFRCFADRSIRRSGCQAVSQRGEHMATSRQDDFDDDLSHCQTLNPVGVGASLFRDLL